MKAFNRIQLKVPASTLIEVTTAMVIISMIFTVAITVYLNVQKASFSSQKLSSLILLDRISAQLKKSGTADSKQFEIDEFVVVQAIEQHPSFIDLTMVNLEIRSGAGKLLAQKKWVMYVPNEK
jgi:hypothetical protein